VAEAQFQAAQERMRKLEAARDGLELAIDLYDSPEAEDSEPATPVSADSAHDGTGSRIPNRLPGIPDPPAQNGKPSNVDLADAVLNESGKPTPATGVRSRINEAGYPLGYDQVRGALSWLERSGRARRTAPGVWELVPADHAALNGAVGSP